MKYQDFVKQEFHGKSENFNLLEEDWIPVLFHNGEIKRIGIRRVLKDAHKIRQIAINNPMDRVAILRFLLALLYWCKGNPENKVLASGDAFPVEWFTKLEANDEYFNLLGCGRRFYQYKIENSKDTMLAANYLLHEIPTGTNIWHFRHSTDKINGLCPACCVMGLLRLPVFATSAGRGKPPGINSKPPIYIIPVGKSLAKTLRFSWRRVAQLGTPAWVEPDMKLPLKGDVPLLAGLTWLPRRVWLDDPGEVSSCISCGSREPLIRQCAFAPIGSQKTDDDSRNWRDPHVVYQHNNKGERVSLHSSDSLKAPDAAATQWTKVLEGILQDENLHSTGSLWVVGFASVKNDKYLEVIESIIPITAHAQGESIARWKEDKLQDKLRKIIRGKRKARKNDAIIATATMASIRPHVEGKVSAKAGELFDGDDESWELAAREYSPMMAAIAKSISPGCTTAAVKRRKQISHIRPDAQARKTKNMAAKGEE